MTKTIKRTLNKQGNHKMTLKFYWIADSDESGCSRDLMVLADSVPAAVDMWRAYFEAPIEAPDSVFIFEHGKALANGAGAVPWHNGAGMIEVLNTRD